MRRRRRIASSESERWSSGTPSIQTRPPVVGQSPAIARSSVLLPEPLGPSIARKSPAGISRSIPLTASTVTRPRWYVTRTFSSRTAGDVREGFGESGASGMAAVVRRRASMCRFHLRVSPTIYTTIVAWKEA